MKNNKLNIPFYLGILLYVISFFLPTIQFSLGVKLLGWETVFIQWSEIVFVKNTAEYLQFLLSSLTNLWVVGLIIGGISNSTNRLFRLILAILALVTSFSWLFVFENNSILLYGFYVWLLSIILIVVGRFLEKK